MRAAGDRFSLAELGLYGTAALGAAATVLGVLVLLTGRTDAGTRTTAIRTQVVEAIVAQEGGAGQAGDAAPSASGRHRIVTEATDLDGGRSYRVALHGTGTPASAWFVVTAAVRHGRVSALTCTTMQELCTFLRRDLDRALATA